jgi:prepilin-type processing-associated H-X9-DG protein/prepilin-type N-terminal cleavage/methylation domain-containing protein
MRTSATTHSPRAFTLVELLVVLGIISVLVALLMPVLVGMRKKAQSVVCAANLRSIGQAMALYTQRYDHYPTCYVYHQSHQYAIWPVRLRELTGGEQGVFYCPAQDERAEWKRLAPEPGVAGRATDLIARFGYDVGEPLLDRDSTFFSYGYNVYGAVDHAPGKGLGEVLFAVSLPGDTNRELRANRVRKPAQMIAVADATCDGVSDFSIVPNPFDPRARPGRVHNGGANVLFCDGHVQWYPQKDLLVTYNQTVLSEYTVRRMWNYDHHVNGGGTYDRDDGG